jgi:hypothetical protein
VDGDSGEFAILNCHDGGCGTGGTDAIADRIDLSKAGFKTGIDGDKAFGGCEAQVFRETGLFLAYGFDDLVGLKDEL